jgi:hypothetical protein
MNTIDIDRAARTIGSAAAIAIVAALALSFAIATVGSQANAAGGDVLAWMGDYLTEVGEALGSG